MSLRRALLWIASVLLPPSIVYLMVRPHSWSYEPSSRVLDWISLIVDWAAFVLAVLAALLFGFVLAIVTGASRWPAERELRQRIHRWIRSLSERLVSEGWITFVAPTTLLVTVGLICLCRLERFDDFRMHLYLGIAAILDVILSLVILANLEKTKISSARELLAHFALLLHDGINRGVKVRVIHFFPNPGQFDSQFKLVWSNEFDDLEELIKQAADTGHPPEFIALEGDPKADGTSAGRFLKEYFRREQYWLSGRQRKYAQSSYLGAASEFWESRVRANVGGVIDKGWLEKTLAGEPFVLVGLAKEKGFIGSVRFTPDRLEFDGTKIEGQDAVAGLDRLYKELKSTYEQPPPP